MAQEVNLLGQKPSALHLFLSRGYVDPWNVTQRPSSEDWTSDSAVEGVALLHVPTLVANGEPALTLLS
jgi:hypothetical protein